MPKLNRSQKIILSLVIFVLVIVVLSATGVMKFKFTVNKNYQSSIPDTTPPKSESTQELTQQAKLTDKPSIFTAAKNQTAYSIKLPIGWKTASNEKVDFVAGSLTPEKLPNGQNFTANINAQVGTHQAATSTFADYQTKWKEALLTEYPSMEFIRDSSIQINGMDVYILEINNSRPDGLVLHQTQYIFYLDNQYAMAVTATTPSNSWNQYRDVILQSVSSIEKVSRQTTK